MKGKILYLKPIRALLFLLALLLVMPGISSANGVKSLYVNADLNSGSPIEAWAIQSAPTYLTFQATSNTTGYGGVGLAIDTDSATLFVTFEFSGTLKIVDATTLFVPALGVTAPGASNLAGIVVDQELARVYTVDRNTDNLYVYDWDASTTTLALNHQYNLPGASRAIGLALDEINDILYVSTNTTTVYYYSTSDFNTLAGTISLANRAIGIAVDVPNGFLYTGASWVSTIGYDHFSQYDLNANAETVIHLGYGKGVMGAAVDQDTGLVYVTTGYGEDAIRVYDSGLNLLLTTAGIGNPTGIVVPGVAISYNPLNLTKDDGLGEEGCVYAGDTITYELCYDNTANTYDVDNVTMVDTLPSEVNFVSATGSWTYNSTGHEVNWDLGALAAGAPQQCVDLVVVVDTATAPETVFTNNATIESADTGPAYANEETEVYPNQPPVADPNGPYMGAAGSSIGFDGTGSSDPDGDPLTFAWDFGDSNTGTAAMPSNSYAAAGIYDVCLIVNDGYVDSEQVCTYAVVYDPSAGFVTGGGWIYSEPGAYFPDQTLEGKANFGFVSKYKKGADTPTGSTEFQFHAGDLNFHSDSYDWLVVTGSDYARFKGLGTINGEGDYKFMLWAGDGEPDTFRIRIWEEDEISGDETDIYDNGFDQEIEGGSIVIHTKK